MRPVDLTMTTPTHTNGNGKPRVVERLVKHTFSCDERNELGAELARTIALRIQVGNRRIDERLDGEQRACKLRSDAIARGARRAQEWLTENLGKEAADGFKNSILDAVEEHKARVE